MCKTSCAVCQTNARRWRDFHGERIKEHLEVGIEEDGYTLEDLIEEEFTEEEYVKESHQGYIK